MSLTATGNDDIGSYLLNNLVLLVSILKSLSFFEISNKSISVYKISDFSFELRVDLEIFSNFIWEDKGFRVSLRYESLIFLEKSSWSYPTLPDAIIPIFFDPDK